jgi:hypothetical protein
MKIVLIVLLVTSQGLVAETTTRDWSLRRGAQADGRSQTAFAPCHAAIYNILVFSVAIFHARRSERTQGGLISPLKLVTVYDDCHAPQLSSTCCQAINRDSKSISKPVFAVRSRLMRRRILCDATSPGATTVVTNPTNAGQQKAIQSGCEHNSNKGRKEGLEEEPHRVMTGREAQVRSQGT